MVIYLKRVVSVLLSLVLAIMSTVCVTAKETVKGDFNGDGKISAIDAREILMVSAGTKTATKQQISNCDINGDGKLDENDLTALTSKYGEVTGTECADNVEVYYRWGNSYSTCTATAMCTLCGKKVATETVNSVQNADGSYTATFTNTLLGTKTYSSK